ncbi:polyprenyl synthetase family protein [Succinivibrio faecicola]|uniref:Polyprenyl synthetase family protein n=1 Tax=Succinivibrio faecicola TaxID=2820300 RepID=A0ABS7DFH2_9GAMM|nr:polyprenyl synthetase family protein [Succinivibrio faecicola]MBW7570018.1 polyprenyl synthetase family protein [Succinivibrio faecicola]
MISQKEIIKTSLDKVEKILSNLLTGSDMEEHVNSMCLSVVKAGGKRIRPKLALASFYALNQKQEQNELVEYFAAACELLHTASLVHDDVIDKATIRRGVKTLNETDGNHAAVLAGDYLFTKCFLCLNNIKKPEIFTEINNTLATLVSGELAQLKNQNKLNISIDDYLQTIYSKTGALFELATSGSAIILECDENTVNAFKEYGKQLGIAFQVADDILDYSSDNEILGKSVGEDLIDGRVTLPLIYALQSVDNSDRSDLENAIKDGNFMKVLDYIVKTGSLEKSHQFALNAAENAKNAICFLDDSEYKELLFSLADKAVNRDK